MRDPAERGEEAGASSSPLDRFAAAISGAGGLISSALILVVLIITGVGVWMRYVIGQPIAGVEEATGFFVVAIVMFGAAEASRRNDHIRIDIILDKAPPRLRRWLDIWAQISVLAFAAALLVTAWHTVSFSRRFGAYSPGYLELPMWIPQSAMIAGGGLILLVCLARLFILLRGGRT
ncbi:TRAP transporter small permease [Pannonibacter sp. Q-1]|uniref:TRAP transporter small permease protein n=1 Tax=Pannonibacter phragmitetus TaxID=121719 RepID=A0A0L0IWS6_9HYPH|nr:MULTISPECIES: TRAP transporter small permease [Pannonibacter]ALV26766.1 TRAP transporter [Pannonibacter phragmitetus]KND17724.1 TRAP transporter [Pannonibacter phragmitetus]MBA4207745.1 2,3-diketo-L-gulonate TRAP transporter small permease YiaM [Polymorphum sp.]